MTETETKYDLIVLSSQRERIYINITDQKLDINNLWYEASKKRYLKHEGFHNGVSLDTILELRKLSGTKCIRYFDSIEGFLNW